MAEQQDRVSPYLQGLIRGFKTDLASRHSKNFNPKRGRSLQTIEALQLHGRTPLPNSKGKFLFFSKDKLDFEGEKLTARQIMKKDLEGLKRTHGGSIHARDNLEQIKIVQELTSDSQKEGYSVIVRPLISYSERNTEQKTCKYGSYKDGARYRCVQNLNHKKGGGGEVTARPSEMKQNKTPDRRTKTQNRAVNVLPYVRKRRRDEEPAAPAVPRATAAVPPAAAVVPKKRRGGNELRGLADYNNPPKTKQ